MANDYISQVTLPNKQVYDLAVKANNIQPSITKTYSSTNFYGTDNTTANCTFFFMSVKPDTWTKPWQVRFKIHSYCPAYMNGDSITWSTFNGRADAVIYANWNEHYEAAHQYIGLRILKKAGFEAELGHAFGINIVDSWNRTNSAYYRTFEIEVYDYENCTVTLNDNAVKWSSWANGTDTNYNGFGNYDAVNRGLRESSDDNDYTTIRSYYDRITAGAGGLMRYSLAMRDSAGKWQSFTTTSGTGTSKTKNTAGFVLGEIVYLNMSGEVTSGNIVGWNVTAHYTGLINYRYSTNAGGTLTSNLMLYIVGSINANDGLFYLDDTWWTTTLPTTENGKIYIPIGIIYPDTAGSTYRCDFSGWHTPLQYINGKLRSYEMPSFNTTQTFYKGLEVKGHVAGDGGSTGHGLYNGGAYHNAYNNIILHGDNSTGSSGIAFVSDKVNNSTGVITNINQPSDRAFIQYHACGVTTLTAEGTAPTIATSGEVGRLVIGVGNDAGTASPGDQLYLQTKSNIDILHLVASSTPTLGVIPDTGNTTGSVGGTNEPVYVDGGQIKACTTYANAIVAAAGKLNISSTINALAKFSDTVGTITSTSVTIDSHGTMQIIATPDTNSVWGISLLALNGDMADSSNNLLKIGKNQSNYNSGYYGFHYVSAGSTSNYLTMGMNGKDHLVKIYGTGQLEISTNITSTNTTTGSLIVKGGTGIAGALYVGGNTAIGTTTAGSLGLAQTNGTGLGISLYGGPKATGALEYGIMFAKTTTFGTCGSVTSDWATYFTMNRNDARGWIFKSNGGTANGNNNVTSIAANGNIYTIGNITVGSNVTLQWNSTDQSLDFVFA